MVFLQNTAVSPLSVVDLFLDPQWMPGSTCSTDCTWTVFSLYIRTCDSFMYRLGTAEDSQQ